MADQINQNSSTGATNGDTVSQNDPEAQRMLQFLQFFVSIQDDSFIANNSIIREFIGGSILVD